MSVTLYMLAVKSFLPKARPPFWKRQTRDENVDNFIKSVFHSGPEEAWGEGNEKSRLPHSSSEAL